MDLAIHEALVRAIKSQRLSRMYNSITAEIRLCIMELRPVYPVHADLAAEHRQILDAIATGNAELAAETMRLHLHKGFCDIIGTRSRDAEVSS